MSTHEALVVRLGEIKPHSDPETINLGLVSVWGYQVVVNKHQWKEGDLAVYIEPDNLVDGSRPEFVFLNKPDKPPTQHRIKVKRLRGVWSEGCLIPAPEGLTEGDDAWTMLGLERYVPQARGRKGGSRPANLDADFGAGGGWEPCPERAKVPFGKYDIENWKKWQGVFVDGEEVIISEKIHGANAKFTYLDGRMWCGSRAGWRTEDNNFWWNALAQNPWIEEACRAYPDLIFYGEIFGQVQDLKYGAKQNELFFRIFDAWNMDARGWVDNKNLLELNKDYLVPILYIGPYTKEKVLELTDGRTTIPGADHVREGIVIKPSSEKVHPRLGRILAKNVSNEYLERS